jgi:hypothetical protein
MSDILENKELMALVFPERVKKMRRTRVSLLCFLVMICGIFLGCLAIKSASSLQIKKLVNKAQTKYGVLINYSQPFFNLAATTLTNIELRKGLKGHIGEIKPSIRLALFDDKIIKISHLNLLDISIEANVQDLLSLLKTNSSAHLSSSENSIGINQHLPENIQINNAQFKLKTKLGLLEIELNELDCQLLRFNCHLDLKNVALDGRNFLAPQEIDFSWVKNSKNGLKFSLSSKAATTKTSLLNLIASWSSKSQTLKTKIKLAKIPSSLANLFSFSSTNLEHGHLLLKGELKVDPSDSSTILYAVDFDGMQLELQHPRMANSIIGPWSFFSHWRGRWSPQNTRLSLRHGIFGARGHGVDFEQAHLSKVKLVGQFDYASNQRKLTANIHLGESPCQSILNSMPPGLIENSEAYKLSGNIGGEFILRYRTDRPDLFELKSKDVINGCHTEELSHISSLKDLKFSRNLVENESGRLGVGIEEGSTRENFISYPDLPPQLIKVFVHSEDWRFFSHQGIDLSQIEGAIRYNLKHPDKLHGGSTISQQTAKNLFLGHSRTLSRKLDELLFTAYLEEHLSKERIIELYLNIIEFGPETYGIVNAAKLYFDKKVDQLTLKESVFLASLLPAPDRRSKFACRSRFPHLYEKTLNKKIQLLEKAKWIDQQDAAIGTRQNLVFQRSNKMLRKMCAHHRNKQLELAMKR